MRDIIYTQIGVLLASCWLCGCGAPRHVRSNEGQQSIESKMPVVVPVVRRMGELAGNYGTCWIDLGKSEYEWVKREFESKPPIFRYNQAVASGVPEGDVLISIRSVKLGSETAVVWAAYISQHVTNYRFTLIREGRVWRVVGSEFLGAS